MIKLVCNYEMMDLAVYLPNLPQFLTLLGDHPEAADAVLIHELRRTGERARPAMLYRAREREMRIIPLFK